MTKRIINIVFALLLSSFTASAQFDPCKFNFGTDWDYLEANQSSTVANEVNYVTKWIVNAKFSDNAVYGRHLDFCVSHKKTPVYYAYIIAKAAALGDADVGGALGTKGAEWLKNNFNNVKNYYSGFAQSVASKLSGSNIAPIFLMEPDFYQYASGPQSSPLSFQQAGDYMGQLIDIIRQQIPNAMIAIDISPWIEDHGSTSGWYGAMPLSKVDFLYTSGGTSQAGSANIKTENKMTWSGIYNATKKGIIADCGYGAGGGSTGHNAAWDNLSNLNSRITDGVIAITQKNPNGSWGIASLRTSLANATVKSCGSAGTQYTLTINTGTGGTVAKNPNNEKYASGSKVTLVAKPSAGYKFKNWTGASTSTDDTIILTMDDNKTVSAVFEQIPANSFTLSVITTGSGSVTVSPIQEYYTSGTSISLTAKPLSGVSVFDGWSGGGLSGSNLTTTLKITANTTVTATFRDTLKIDSIKVEAENFKAKNGEKLVTETKGSVISIGYIENGYSTTYQIDVDIAGSYNLAFNVGTGLSNVSFTVSVDGKDVGTVSFNGVVDDWSSFHKEVLNGTVDLSKGSHTVQLNFGGAVNVDWFTFVLDEAKIPVLNRKTISVQNLKVVTQKNGFLTSLPSGHDFTSYSLYDCKGRMAGSGFINTGVSELSFSNLSKNIWILRLKGKISATTVRAAVVR